LADGKVKRAYPGVGLKAPKSMVVTIDAELRPVLGQGIVDA
jgi:hypothetical protein